jgi:DNA modification methylase
MPELLSWGFEEKDLIGGGFDLPKDEKEDEIPEVPVEPVSKLGDLYILGNHRVLCGDSTDESLLREVMGKKTVVDAIITDPPYGIAYEESKNWAKADYVKRPIIGDNHKFDYRNTAFPQSKSICVWGANYFADTIPNFYDGNYVVWAKAHSDKENEVFGSAFELCWMYPKHKQMVWFVRRVNMSGEEHGLHVTQKPLDVMRRCIEYTKVPQGGLIYDAFLGSGSTLIAAEKTGRICYGMEIDPHYVDVIIKRYIDFTGKDAVRLSDGKKWSEI